METLYLKRDEDRRVKRGHPWIYSNELDVARSPIKTLTPGATVSVCDARGQPIGVGHVSPASLIAVRMLDRQRDQRTVDLDDIIGERIRRALAHRDRLYPEPFYRLVYGEGDGLPGLVVDRFGDACVVQTSTWGMERSLSAVLAHLDEVLAPATLIVKNDAGGRVAEGLPSGVEVIRGASSATVLESGGEFRVDLAGGQKTGWFYDQRDNRVRLRPGYAGARVLDLHSYVGGWGVVAAQAGADKVICVDASPAAVEAIEVNARHNGVADRIEAVRGDAVAVLESGRDQFDIVVLDPPALVKRRKDLKAGRGLYRHLNGAALARVAPGGVLISSSCSSQIDADTLFADVRAAARHARRDIALIGRGGMPFDHPIHPLLPEMEYLKCLFLRVE